MKKQVILLLAIVLMGGSEALAQRHRGEGRHQNDRRGHQKAKKHQNHEGHYYTANYHYRPERPVRRVSRRNRHHKNYHAYQLDYHGQHYRYQEGQFYVQHHGYYQPCVPPIGFRLDFAPYNSRHVYFRGHDYFVSGDLIFRLHPRYGFYERVYAPRGFWAHCH